VKLVVNEYFIKPTQTLTYAIHFENIGEIEARDIFLTDVLSESLDLSTIKFLANEPGVLNSQTRTVRWELLDRNLLPGESDSVVFSIQPVLTLPSGTEILNNASIQFEVFETLVTEDVINVIDSTAPECIINELPNETENTEFDVTWTGTDSVGLIDLFTVLVSEDGGELVTLIETGEQQTIFVGEVGRTYGFLCIASDTAGNIEAQSSVAATTTIILPTGELPGDFNGDGCVDRSDHIILISFVQNGEPYDLVYDLNGDGKVNRADGRKLVMLYTNSRGAACE
jgi:uncharacterized repeat protein (TIGR01451 family)